MGRHTRPASAIARDLATLERMLRFAAVAAAKARRLGRRDPARALSPLTGLDRLLAEALAHYLELKSRTSSQGMVDPS